MAEKLAQKLSNFNIALGRMVSWASLLLVLLVFTLAVLRYVFKIGSIPMQEVVLYLHSALFMLAGSYALAQDEHVRVDVFYSQFSERNKAWVNLLGVILFLLPLCVFLIYFSWNYVSLSWSITEGSREAGGLPFLFLLKSMLIALPILLALQGLAMLLKALVTISGHSTEASTEVLHD